MPVDIDPAANELMRDDSATLRHAESAGESDVQLRLAIDLAGIASWRHDRASGRICLNDLGWAVLDLAPRAEGIVAAELRQFICRVVVELYGRRELSATAVAKELTRRGFKNRAGKIAWDHKTVQSIFKRWNGKL